MRAIEGLGAGEGRKTERGRVVRHSLVPAVHSKGWV